MVREGKLSSRIPKEACRVRAAGIKNYFDSRAGKRKGTRLGWPKWRKRRHPPRQPLPMLDLVDMPGRDYGAMDPADARYAGLAGCSGRFGAGRRAHGLWQGDRFGAATVPV
ncbi:hypothetical protein ACWHA1_39685 [Streptomyces decoyicus]